MPSRQLVECLRTAARCGLRQERIQDELARRKEVRFLVSAYEKSKDVVQRGALVEALSSIDDLRVTAFMRRILTENADRRDYYAAQYLARKGDRKALSILNKNYFQYPVPSLVWAETVRLFGQYGFREAIPHLIGSIDSAEMNVGVAAVNSLRALFPGSPAEFASIDEARRYFAERARKESIGR